MSSSYRCPATRRSAGSTVPSQQHPTIKDVAMIHAMPPESFLRHHAEKTDRIVERYQLRRFAVARKLRGPRSRTILGA